MINKHTERREVESSSESRVTQIMALLDHDHLNTSQLEKVSNLIDEYNEIFILPQDKLPATTAMELNVPLDTKKPIFTKQYKLPKLHEEAVMKQALKWLDEGVIRDSVSCYNNPVLCVEKKTLNADGSKKLRVCTDLRKINEHVIKSYYHLPSIHTLLREIGKAKYFTTLDCSQGYLQLGVCEEDKRKLAFTVGHRRFEFNRCPFGLVSASYAFSSLIQSRVLADVIRDHRVFTYLDDILILADSEEEMFMIITKILECFRKHTLRLNVEKLEIFKNSVQFLGHVVSADGISPAWDKIAAIKLCKPPTNVSGVMSFLACGNFFKQFIPYHSDICEPLLKLTRKATKFVWTEKCQESFDALKTALTNPPLLAHASELEEEGSKTILMCDASKFAIGGCLSVLRKDGSIKPIAYTSRTLQKAERNFFTYHREMLSIVDNVTIQFPFLLLNRMFYVLTDHRPLVSITTTSLDVLEGRVLRWRLKLARFAFRVIYIKGATNAIADTLSRLSEDDFFIEEISCEQISKAPSYMVSTRANKKLLEASKELSDPIEIAHKLVQEANQLEIEEELNDNFVDENEQRSVETQAMIPTIGAKHIKDKKLQTELIKLYHEHPLAGHIGIKRGIKKLSGKFFWRGMLQQYSDFVRRCEICQRCKYKNRNPPVPLGTLNPSPISISEIFFDITGPFTPSGEAGFVYILSAQCALTRFAISRPIVNKDTNTVAKVLFEEIFLVFGFPHTLISDQAKEFTSDVINKLMKLVKIKKGQCSIYRANSNIVERYQGTLKTYLTCFLINDKIKDNWSDFVKLAVYVFNSAPHSRTGFAPFTLLLGHVTHDVLSELNLPPIYTYNNYYDDFRHRIKIMNEAHREKALRSILKDKKTHDDGAKEKTFFPDERVLVKKFVTKPLDPPFEPVVVVDDTSTHNVKVIRNNKEQIIHKDHIWKISK